MDLIKEKSPNAQNSHAQSPLFFADSILNSSYKTLIDYLNENIFPLNLDKSSKALEHKLSTTLTEHKLKATKKCIEDLIKKCFLTFNKDVTLHYDNYKNEFVLKVNSTFNNLNDYMMKLSVIDNKNDQNEEQKAAVAFDCIKNDFLLLDKNISKMKETRNALCTHLDAAKDNINEMKEIANNPKPLYGKERIYKTKLSVLLVNNEKLSEETKSINNSILLFENGISGLFQKVIKCVSSYVGSDKVNLDEILAEFSSNGAIKKNLNEKVKELTLENDKLKALYNKEKENNELITQNSQSLAHSLKEVLAEKDQLKEEALKLKADIEKKNEEIDQAKKEHAKVSQECSALQTELQESKKKIEQNAIDFSNKIKALEEKITQYEECIKAKDKAIESKNKEISSLNVSKLNQESTIKKNKEDYENQVKALKAEIESLKAKESRKESEEKIKEESSSKVRKELDDKVEAFNELLELKEKLEKDLESSKKAFEAKIKELEKENELLKKGKESSEKDNDAFKSEMEKLKVEAEKEKEKNENLSKELLELSSQINDMKGEKAEMASEKEKMAKEKEEAAARLKEITDEKATSESKLSSFTEENSKLKSLVEKIEKEKEDALNENKQLNDKILKILNQSTQLESSIEKMQSELKAKENEFSSYVSNQSLSQNDTLKKLTEREKEKSELELQIKDLQAKIDEYSNQITEKEKTFQKLKKTNEDAVNTFNEKTILLEKEKTLLSQQMEEEKSKAKKEKEELTQKISEVENEAKLAKDELIIKEEKLSECDHQIKEFKDKISQLESAHTEEVKALNEKLSQALIANEGKEKEIKVKEDEIEKLTKEINLRLSRDNLSAESSSMDLRSPTKESQEFIELKRHYEDQLSKKESEIQKISQELLEQKDLVKKSRTVTISNINSISKQKPKQKEEEEIKKLQKEMALVKDKNTQLQSLYNSAKDLIETLKKSNEQTKKLLEEKISEISQFKHKEISFSCDNNNVTFTALNGNQTEQKDSSVVSSYRKEIFDLIKQISPELISKNEVDFKSNSSTTDEDVFDVMLRFQGEIIKVKSKARKYKEMIPKFTKRLTETRKENSNLIAIQTDLLNKLNVRDNQLTEYKAKIDSLVQDIASGQDSNTIPLQKYKDILNLFTTEEESYRKSLAALREENERIKKAILVNNDNVSVASLNSDLKPSFQRHNRQMSQPNISNDNPLTFERFDTGRSYNFEDIERNLEENEELFKGQMKLLKDELRATKKELEKYKKAATTIEGGKSEVTIPLKQSFEKLLPFIKIDNKNKEYILVMMKVIGYTESEINQLTKKGKKGLFGLFNNQK